MRTIRILLTCIMSLILYGQPVLADLPKPLVETEWLAKNLEQVFILDVRKSVESFTAKPVYEKDKATEKNNLVKVGGHIPSANFILYKSLRGGQKINGINLKYMLPEKSSFESLMQKSGLNSDSLIVVVTNAENDFDVTMAARIYWQFKYFGHDEVSILDGGTAQWIADGYDISSTSSMPSAGNWQVKEERRELLANSNDVVAAINDDSTQLIDVRPLGQYLGTNKSSKVSEKGHIQSSKSYPVELIANRKLPIKFSSRSELLEVSDALGIKSNLDSITYCNSGHMAAGGWFVMYALLGNENVKLYDGSMHQWTAEKRPVVKMKME